MRDRPEFRLEWLLPPFWPYWVWACFVFCLGLRLFSRNLGGEPHFMDESAYTAQSYYFDLWSSGSLNDREWIDFPGLDNPGHLSIVRMDERVPRETCAFPF